VVVPVTGTCRCGKGDGTLHVLGARGVINRLGCPGAAIDIRLRWWVDRFMKIERDSEQRSVRGRADGCYLYFLSLGLVGGGAVIGFAFLPRSLAGFVSLGAFGLWRLIEFLSRRFASARFSPRLRKGAATVVYYVVLGLVLVSASALDIFVVRRGDLAWLAWALSGVVFTVGASAVWLVDGRHTSKTALAT
jgi:hypothetical protein